MEMTMLPPNHLLSPDGQGQKDFHAENFKFSVGVTTERALRLDFGL
jgi:hypothetical protein